MNNREDWDIRIAEMNRKYPKSAVPNAADDGETELQRMQLAAQDNFASFMWRVIALVLALIVLALLVRP